MTSLTQQLNNGIGSVVTYTTDQINGLTATTLHQYGFLHYVDAIWLTLTRLKTIVIVGSLVMAIISMLLITLSGKKESFSIGLGNVITVWRQKAGQALKKALYL